MIRTGQEKAEGTRAPAPRPTIILVLGDSLSLPRQKAGVGHAALYPYRLAEWMRGEGWPADVWNLSQAGTPLRFLAAHYSKSIPYLRPKDGGVAILQVGVVDCPPRPVPLRIRNAISKLPGPARRRIVELIHRYRREIINVAPDFSFTPPAAFRQQYRGVLECLSRDFSLTIVINICPAGPYFLKRSPGVDQRIGMYNGIIADSLREFPNARLVDAFSEFSDDGGMTGCMSPKDGHHLTSLGHRRLFELVAEHLREHLGPHVGSKKPASEIHV